MPKSRLRARDAISAARDAMPTTRQGLWNWVYSYTGVRLAHRAVCRGHSAPFDAFAQQVLERPTMALWLGSRGSGKSFQSGLDTHITSRFNPGHETCVLGGSAAQSEQIYRAIGMVAIDGSGPLGSERDTIDEFRKESATYANGSIVRILAASSKSARGPHVPTLKLDEVDEIEPEIRESSMGMVMGRMGVKASVLMTSTWHKVAGPMAGLVAQAREGAFPIHTFCMFEAMERCPEGRSGTDLENCPACPLVKWCHDDLGSHPSGVPKLKRSSGHYLIDDAIRQTFAVSERVFESDFLCLKPRSAGLWFHTFSEAAHVTEAAEYTPRLPVHLAIDCGHHTGAVWFQVSRDAEGRPVRINVFGDYYAVEVTAEDNAYAVMRANETLCGVGLNRMRVSIDPAAGQKGNFGITVLSEYNRVGLRGRTGLELWGRTSSKSDDLQFLEALLRSANGAITIFIHPRCRNLIQALSSYVRATKDNQWMDYAKDPQHPFEDLVDPLVGGLKAEFPDRRMPAPSSELVRVHAGKMT